MIQRYTAYFSTAIALSFLLFTLNAALAKDAIEKSIPIINYAEDGDYKEKVFLASLEMIYFYTEGIVKSINRYYSWCCANKSIGPQNERYASRGLYSIPNYKLIFPINEKIKKDPGLENIRVYIDVFNNSIQKALPIINQAAKYYDEESYKLDNFEGAREFHQKMHPLLTECNSASSKTAAALLANIEPFKEVFLPRIAKNNNEADTEYYTTLLLFYELKLNDRLNDEAKNTVALKKELKTHFLQLKMVYNDVTVNNTRKMMSEIDRYLTELEINSYF